jgi:Predicted integral membrane protein
MPRAVRLAITIIAVVAIVVLAVRRIDWSVVVHSISHASLPFVIAAGVITFASTLLKGVRWWLFLRGNSEIKLGRIVRLTILGTGANSVLFANAGDMIRVGMAARETRLPVATVLSALASDKVVEVLAFASMMLLALGGHLPGVVRDKVEVVVIALVAVLAGVAIAISVAKGGFLRWLEHTRNLLRGRTVFIAYALSLLSWGVQIATYMLGTRAVGLNVPLSAIVVTVVGVNVAGVVRSTPGNLGVFQLMFVLALAPFGVATAQAVAAAVLVQSAQILSAVITAAAAASRYRSGA